MKKLIAFIFCFIATDAIAANSNWWERSTVCAPNNAECFPNMSVGFDEMEWDEGANCRGMKMICPNAVLDLATTPAAWRGISVPTPISRADIADNTIIDADFDITVLDSRNACFGSRRTRNNGSSARVTGTGNGWVNVWCPGVLDFVDEVLDTGEIVLDANDQPNCRRLADDGFIGILNGQCFGLFGFPRSDFFLDCRNNNNPLLPSRIAVLNGATNYNTSTSFSPPGPQQICISPSPYPTCEEHASHIFSHMVDNAALTRHRNAAQALADASND